MAETHRGTCFCGTVVIEVSGPPHAGGSGETLPEQLPC
jgi:hypothetical protein